jgi:hypothetical protein
MPPARCPYFSLQVVEVPIEASNVTTHRLPSKLCDASMKLSVCRCSLTEALVTRLQTHAEGHSLASFMEGPAIDGARRPIVGSDLEPISTHACTQHRCSDRCLPGFVEILGLFGLNHDVPEQPAPRPRPGAAPYGDGTGPLIESNEAA